MAERKTNDQLQQTPVAIIGMACILPQARNLQEYWNNIINKTNCITDVPASRWNIDDYYDPDPNTPDKTYCKRGGFIPDIDFNPLEYGLPPNILEVTDVSQMLSLIVAKEAIADAGYDETRDFDRARTGVILGVGGGQKLFTPLTSRLQYPVWEKALKSSGLSDEDTQKIIEKIKLAYIKWEENSFPGMLGNVIAGRIANRLNLGGINSVVDAACASSLSALSMAISQLTEFRSDMMITGGVDTDSSPLMYLSFSKTPAFSKQQNARPFDADADGMILGEGIGMVVLKRLEEAQRDGDRIYAVIKGIGASSDGKFKSIYAPRASGQVLALRRAYEEAGFAPASVGAIEAHGTGTMAGDPAEFAALNAVFSENDSEKQQSQKQQIALGSVKSQIGHTKAAAGAASLIKMALALHHKVLPPTININQPHPQLQIENSPFYLNTESRPWIRALSETPRRAGISAFGFGGTNFHVVLEEYSSEQNQGYRLHHNRTEILLAARTKGQLLAQCQTVLQQLQAEDKAQHYAKLIDASNALKIPSILVRVGFVSESIAEACELLQMAIDFLSNPTTADVWEHPRGVYYRKTGISPQAKVVALFSGQGSQYLEMGKELALNFPTLRQAYAELDNIRQRAGLLPISSVVFPRPTFSKAEKEAQATALNRTEYTQPAIAAFSVGLYKILQQAGFKPDFVAGHSFGELTALWSAGVLRDEDYFSLVNARGQAMAVPQNSHFDAGAMIAVKGAIDTLKELIADFPQITIANYNSNTQVVLAGTKPEMARVQQALTDRGFVFIGLPVSAAFHTPLVSYAQKRFAQAIRAVPFREPTIPVFSNITGNRYPGEPEKIRQTLEAHLLNPVLFKQEIETIYAAGGYYFVEFGPKSILTNLVNDTLGDRPHLAVALNPHSRQFKDHQKDRHKDSDRVFREAVVQLRVAGLPLGNVDRYWLPTVVRPQPHKSLNVRLNGSNYVSEKTQAAFAKALQNGHQVTQPAPISLVSQPEVFIMSESPNYQQNYQQQFLESLERSLSHFQAHQIEVLRFQQHLQEQSLKNQQEYTKSFLQLMQQGYALMNADRISVDNVIPASGTVSIGSDTLIRNGKMSIVHPAEAENHHKLLSSNSMSLAEISFPENNHEPISNNGHLPDQTSLTENSHLLVSSNDLPSVQTPSEMPNLSVSRNGLSPVQGKASTLYEPALSKDLTIIQEKSVEANELISKNGSQPDRQAQNDMPVVPSISENATDLAALSESLLKVVSEKTGYPVDMLELEMEMEADLGIDSIKRVQILGAIQELFPNVSPLNPEHLGELRTLKQIVEQMGNAGLANGKKTTR